MSGSPPLSYQWLKNGVAVSGATTSNYTISSVARSDAGYYSVVVSNPGGSTNSRDAVLDVPGPPANDDFANRIEIVGMTNTVTGYNVLATTESFECVNYYYPYFAYSSVWWTWTAPANGLVTFDTIGSTFHPPFSPLPGNI